MIYDDMWIYVDSRGILIDASLAWVQNVFLAESLMEAADGKDD